MITSGTADFREALPTGGRLMGLDVGTKTIGIALCDAGWTIATPAELIRRSKFSADLEKLRALAASAFWSPKTYSPVLGSKIVPPAE